MTTHTDLIARLRDDEANCHENAGEAADALESLEQQVAALVAERAKSAEQYVARLNQIDALTKERDELEISNAFAHGEWRAVKDQLAALTKERDQFHAGYAESCAHIEATEGSLDAAQAREAKLREVIADTILELCALLEKAEGALKEFDKHTKGLMLPQTRYMGSDALAAIKQWKDQT